MGKPFSEACERNRIPILKVLKSLLSSQHQRLLEIGSGTGQHAVYFAPHFTHLIWVTSDVKENHPGISSWLEESSAPNIIGPGTFEVGHDPFPNGHFDVVFTANTFHIMSWKNCQTLMEMFGKNLHEGALVIIYGPFNYQGKFTSQSNEDFNQSLKTRSHEMAIRNFEDVVSGMDSNGFSLENDHEMPANNRLLVFKRKNHVH